MAQPGIQIAAAKRVVTRVLLALLLLFCLLYIGDYLQFRYRVWRNHQPYGTVTVEVVYAIPEKAPPDTKRTEYTAGSAQDQSCANSLFPQSGFSPCWYLRRNARRQVNM